RPAALDPSLDVALTGPRDRHGARRDVLDDHRARGRVGAVAHLHGRDDHVVAADPHVRADHAAVLVDAVVVHEDRARADVGSLADLGVADVRQVRDLRPLAQVGVLGLDVGADLGLARQAGAGPQVREGADGGLGADLRLRAHRVDHGRAGAHAGVGQRAAGADPRALADVRAAVQLRAREDLGVLLDGDVHVDPGGGRVDDRDPGPHVRLEDAVVQLPPGLGELDPVVHALGLHP